MFGATEASILVGYVFAVFCGCVEFLFYKKQWTIKCITFLSYTTAIILGTGQGFFSLIEDNYGFVILSAVLRAAQGYFVCSTCLALVESTRLWFPNDFQRVNGLIQMGYFAGCGLGQCLGAVLYDHFGYLTPYILTGSLNIIGIVYGSLILPTNNDMIKTNVSPLVEPDANESNYSTISENKGEEKENKLSWFVFIPLLSSMLINCIYGYILVATAPFVVDCCGATISLSGGMMLILSFTLALGNILVGYISQFKLLTDNTLMMIGALCTAFGVFVLFPPPLLSTGSLIPVYVGIILSGFGDPFLAICSIPEMIAVQRTKTGTVTKNNESQINSYWLSFTFAADHFGGFLAGLFMDYFQFYQSGFVMSSLCVLSILFTIITKQINKY